MKSTYIQIRITPEDKASWKAQAKGKGLDLSEWIRLRIGTTVEPAPDTKENLAEKYAQFLPAGAQPGGPTVEIVPGEEFVPEPAPEYKPKGMFF